MPPIPDLESPTVEPKQIKKQKKHRSEHRKKRKRDGEDHELDDSLQQTNKKRKGAPLEPANGTQTLTETRPKDVEKRSRKSKKHRQLDELIPQVADDVDQDGRGKQSQDALRKAKKLMKKRKHKGVEGSEANGAVDTSEDPNANALTGATAKPALEPDLKEASKEVRQRWKENGQETGGDEGDNALQNQLLDDFQQEKKKAKKRRKQQEETSQESLPNLPRAYANDHVASIKEEASGARIAEEHGSHTAFASVSHDTGKKSKRKSKSSKRAVQQESEDEGVDEENPPALELGKVDSEPAAGSKAERRRHTRNEKRRADNVTAAPVDDPFAPDVIEPGNVVPRRGKDKKRGKTHRNRNSQDETDAQQYSVVASTQTDAKPATATAKSAPEYPFFTQTISIYVPVYPIGFAKPHSAAADQHLKPLLNRYSSTLRGVLLAYRHPHISEQPLTNKTELEEEPDDALLMSVDEYAVGFGRLTAEVDLFKPSRGAPMAGNLVLQSEGHIGVVCWGMFNASIEANRLPSTWKWVDLARKREEKTARAKAKALRKQKGEPFEVVEGHDADETWEAEEEDHNAAIQELLDAQEEVDPDDPFSGPITPQMHVTGYWADEHGRRINGSLHFRIKNFDVGLGLGADYGFLSLEGTMLTEEEEAELLARERAEELTRKGKRSGLLRPETRRLPEFGMTTFAAGREDQEQEREVVVSLTRPVTPDD